MRRFSGDTEGATYRGEEKRRLPGLVRLVSICSCLEQSYHHHVVTILRGDKKRRVPMRVRHVDISPSFKKNIHYGLFPLLRCAKNIRRNHRRGELVS